MFCIYILPICTYLSQKYAEITNPMLAKTVKDSSHLLKSSVLDSTARVSPRSSDMIAAGENEMADVLLHEAKIQEKPGESQRRRSFYYALLLGLVSMAYGIGVLALQFVKF
jgi:hypothetical protein